MEEHRTKRAFYIIFNSLPAEGLRGDDALERIVEEIKPAILFHPHVHPYTQFYPKIRDIYVSIGVYVEIRSGYPIVKALSNGYHEREIRYVALAIL